MRTMQEWRSALRAALTDALRARRAGEVSVLRELLGALDNAEAAALSEAPSPDAGPIAGAVSGLGAGEVARRQLTPDEVAAVITRELEERRDAVRTLTAHGRAAEADAVRAQLAVIEALMR